MFNAIHNQRVNTFV